MDTPLSKKELTRQRILDVAARALRRNGFAGVGVAEVMKEAGLTHGGFYAHFASREALLAEAVAHAGRASSASLAQRTQGRQARGASRLRALIEGYLADGHIARTEDGCPLAALISEMPRQSPGLREASTQRVHSLIETVRQALPAPHDKAQATVIVSTLVGALQLARALGPNAQGKAVLAAARASLLATHDAA